MDIRKKAVEPRATLHLKDSADELMYDAKLDAAGNPVLDADNNEVPDLDKPVRVHIFSPGSKQYARANAAKQNRMMEKLRKKGKINETAQQQAEEQAEFLSAVTEGWDNMTFGDSTLTGEALSKAIYSEPSIGFIAEQVGKYLGDWGNFTPTAPKG